MPSCTNAPLALVSRVTSTPRSFLVRAKGAAVLSSLVFLDILSCLTPIGVNEAPQSVDSTRLLSLLALCCAALYVWLSIPLSLEVLCNSLSPFGFLDSISAQILVSCADLYQIHIPTKLHVIPKQVTSVCHHGQRTTSFASLLTSRYICDYSTHL